METLSPIPKYNLNEEQEKKLIIREYRALMRDLKTKLKPGDKDLIRRAFEMAAEAHKTMRRKSGEPYILHPLAVAKILVKIIEQETKKGRKKRKEKRGVEDGEAG